MGSQSHFCGVANYCGVANDNTIILILKNGSKTFMVKPTAMDIIWGADSRYWRLPNSDDGLVELLKVSWLEVSGSLDLKKLEAKDYKLSFTVSMRPDAFGWKGIPVYIMAKVGEGKFIWKKADLSELPVNTDRKAELTFTVTTKDTESTKKLHFGLYEVWRGRWKGGLVIHNVEITPILSPSGPKLPWPRVIPENGSKTFMVKPTAMDIKWGADSRYWRLPNSDDGSVELLQVSWLQVTGSYDLKKLEAKDYKLSFTVSMRPHAFGWKDSPVHFMAKVGEGEFIWKKADLSELPVNTDCKIPAELKFTVTTKDTESTEKLHFGLYEIWFGRWKGGLVIRNVEITPVLSRTGLELSSVISEVIDTYSRAIVASHIQQTKEKNNYSTHESSSFEHVNNN